MAISLFNDVLGPVMRGPSSSHCAAALRIGRIARDLMGGEIAEVVVSFDRAGSLPTTHESQGSDLGLFGGLLGWDAADERLPGGADALDAAGIRVRFETVDTGDPHPNTYRLTLRNSRENHTLVAVSTGGGMIEVLEVDDLPVRMDGGWHETLAWLPKGAPKLCREPCREPCRQRSRHEGDTSAPDVAAEQPETKPPDLPGDEVMVYDAGDLRLVQVKAASFVPDEILAPLRPVRVRRIAPVLPVPSRKDVRVPFTTCAGMLAGQGAGAAPLWKHAAAYEAARGGIGKGEALAMAGELVRVLRRSIEQGVAGTQYEDRVLGCQAAGFARRMKEGGLLDAGALNRMVLYVTAMMEVKSSLGVIVAMPTAGACAALPGALVGMAEAMGLGEEEMARALLAAGLVGAFIATGWTFAAEAGGCQAECGAASAMAAAALVTLAGGPSRTAVAAASMALQNQLGLVCDPVANRVEVPCLGRNVAAAANALACANMALAGYDEVVPLDEVIATARGISAQLPRELRCTALGGLSITPTSRRIEKTLAARRTERRNPEEKHGLPVDEEDR